MIINIALEKYKNIPETLNGEVLLSSNKDGFLTCSQEIAYTYSIAANEQLIFSGHIAHDYSTLDKTVCRKPTLENVAANTIRASQEKLDSLPIPEPAKAGLQNRINGLLVAMQALPFDDGLRLALQLPIDITNS